MILRNGLRGLAGFAMTKVKIPKISKLVLILNQSQVLPTTGSLNTICRHYLAYPKRYKKIGTALAIFIDELQYVQEEELAALSYRTTLGPRSQACLWTVGAGFLNCRAAWAEPNHMPSACLIFPRSGLLQLMPRISLVAKPAAGIMVRLT